MHNINEHLCVCFRKQTVSLHPGVLFPLKRSTISTVSRSRSPLIYLSDFFFFYTHNQYVGTHAENRAIKRRWTIRLRGSDGGVVIFFKFFSDYNSPESHGHPIVPADNGPFCGRHKTGDTGERHNNGGTRVYPREIWHFGSIPPTGDESGALRRMLNNRRRRIITKKYTSSKCAYAKRST